MELKNKVVSGFLWTVTEKFGSTLVQTCVSLILARLLGPTVTGTLSLLLIFQAIASVVVDSGFSQALIQKKQPTDRDYNSVFYLNLGLAIALYLLLVALSHSIARFFNTPELAQLAPWLFTILPISSVGLIQITILTKEMNFRTLTKMYLFSSVIAGVISVWMAFNGYGIWAIVWQQVILNLARSVLVWFMSPWRPSLTFSGAAIKSLFGYGSRIFATGLIAQFFYRLSGLIIGKLYTKEALGFYDTSLKLKDQTANSLSQAVLTVSLPAFSQLQDDRDKLKEASRKVISVLSFALFPVMAGLIAVSEEAVRLILGERWMPAVSYFNIFCLSAFTIPLSNICLNIIKAKGAGNLVLKAEIIKRIFSLAVIVATAFISVGAMVWGTLIFTVFEMMLNILYARRFISYTLQEQLRDTLPSALLSGFMFLCITLAGQLPLTLSPLVWLLLKIVLGIVIYTSTAQLLKLEGWRETTAIIRQLFKHHKP